VIRSSRLAPIARRLAPGVALVLAALAAACAPRFRATGRLEIDAVPFEPSTCQVVPCKGGIALGDGAGARLELGLPPQTLRAWQQIGGTPTLTWLGPGAAPEELGTCGALTLRGEGYHAASKRAAGGSLSLNCPRATGELTFSGCF